MDDATAAQAKASRLQREARNHKRASRKHRDQARETYMELERFIAACAARGITVTINTKPKGGQGGNQNQAGRQAA